MILQTAATISKIQTMSHRSPDKYHPKVKVNCLQCNKEFETYYCNIKVGWGKFCSHKCHNIWRVGKKMSNWNPKSGCKSGKEHFNWKDNAGYGAVHYWLTVTYGKADKCESKRCSKKSKTFQWALKKGYKYEKRRKNFIKLCSSCHVKYDMTIERIQKRLKTIYG